MDTSILISSLCTAGIVGAFSVYVYSKRQAQIKAEWLGREEGLREQVTSAKKREGGLREQATSAQKEAEVLRGQLFSSSAALQESERRNQELTQTLSDPTKFYLDHLRNVRDRSDHLAKRLRQASSRANSVANDLTQRRRNLNRNTRPPVRIDDLTDLIRKSGLALENHAQQITDAGVIVDDLCNAIVGSGLDNLNLMSTDMSSFDELMEFVDGLCAPLTEKERWDQRLEEIQREPEDLATGYRRTWKARRKADDEDPTRAFDRWKDGSLTPWQRFDLLKKAYGQRDGFG